jgi:hypothetical protein
LLPYPINRGIGAFQSLGIFVSQTANNFPEFLYTTIFQIEYKILVHNSNIDMGYVHPNTPAIVSFPRTTITATNSKVIKEYNAKPRIIALLIISGLISAAISIWILSIALSAHAQEYCPSGAVVTAQSQCPGAVGPVDNLTKSILRLNNSGVNNANDTANKIQKDNKSNTGVQTAQNTISNSNMTRSGNMTAAGNMTNAGSNATSSSSSNPLAKIGQALSGLFGGKNMTKSAQASQPLSQPQIPNTIPPQYPAYQQQPYQQQQPYPFQPYQQQPNNNYPPPRILSQSSYVDNIGTVHIVGEVINESPVTAKFVKVIVTFYNAYNQVIGTDNTYTEPTDLAQGQRAPFDIFVTSGVPMSQVRNYALTVDSS